MLALQRVTAINGGFTVAWEDTTSGEKEIAVLYRKHGATVWQADVISITSRSYSVSGLADGTEYDIAVILIQADARATITPAGARPINVVPPHISAQAPGEPHAGSHHPD